MDPYKLYVYNYISGARIHDFIRFYKELFTPKMLRATASLPSVSAMLSEWRFVRWDQDLDHLGMLAPVLTGLKLQVTLGLGRWFYDCDLALACLISAFLSPTMPGSQRKGMIECGQIFGRRWLLLGHVWIVSHYFFMGKVIDTVDGGWLRRKRKREHQGKWKPFKEQ